MSRPGVTADDLPGPHRRRLAGARGRNVRLVRRRDPDRAGPVYAQYRHHHLLAMRQVLPQIPGRQWRPGHPGGMGVRVALYARVSTNLDEKDLKNKDGEAVKRQDPEVQLIKLRRFAENHGWDVVAVYSDRAS